MPRKKKEPKKIDLTTMKTKQQAVDFLKEHGYDAYLESGVVMIAVTNQAEDLAKTQKRIWRWMQENEYYCSIGVVNRVTKEEV